MMVLVPMMTPSVVRKARSLWARMESKASLTPDSTAPAVIAPPAGLRWDRVRGAACRVDAEEQASDGGKPHSGEDRGSRHGHGNGGKIANRDNERPGDHHADQAAAAGKQGGFDQKLPEDIRAPRPDRLAQADLLGSFGNHGHHDVHNHDAADYHENRHYGDRSGGNSSGEPVPELDERVRGDDREVVLLAGTQLAPRTQQCPRFILCLEEGFVARGDRRVADALTRAVHLEVRFNGDHHEVVARDAEHAAKRFGGSGDKKRASFNLDRLAHGVGIREENLAQVVAEEGDGHTVVVFRRRVDAAEKRLDVRDVRDIR